MVYKFRILSDEVDDFVRDLDIISGHTFFNFHQALQQELRYDPSQLASFFLSNDRWEKVKEFTLFDMSDENRSDVVFMDKAVISDYITAVKQKLLYQFDYFSDRVLYIELEAIYEEKAGDLYPVITRRQGLPPRQILSDKILFPGGSPEDLPDSPDNEIDTTDLDEGTIR